MYAQIKTQTQTPKDDAVQPEATAHHGTCSQCAGDGDVITITADPLDLSLCPACLAFLLNRASGARRAIREQWAAVNRRKASGRRKRRTELQAKARADLERVATQADGNGRGT